MKINGSTPTRISAERPEKAAESRHGRQSDTVDRASFAADSVVLRFLESLALEPPPMRWARIHSLRAAIASGEYHVSPEELADAIVDEMVEK